MSEAELSETMKPKPFAGSNHFTRPCNTCKALSSSLMEEPSPQNKPCPRNAGFHRKGSSRKSCIRKQTCPYRQPLRVEAGDSPAFPRGRPGPAQAVVQPEGAIGPEFDLDRADSIAAPERRAVRGGAVAQRHLRHLG